MEQLNERMCNWAIALGAGFVIKAVQAKHRDRDVANRDITYR